MKHTKSSARFAAFAIVAMFSASVLASPGQGNNGNKGNNNGNNNGPTHNTTNANASAAATNHNKIDNKITNTSMTSSQGGSVIGSGNSAQQQGIVADFQQTGPTITGPTVAVTGPTTTVDNKSGASVDLKVEGDKVAATPAVTNLTTSAASLDNGTCFGSVTAGIQVGGTGVGGGSTVLDHGCNRRYNSAHMVAKGMKLAALEIMCGDPEVREAMKYEAEPCPSDRKGAKEQKQAAFGPVRPDLTDNLVRRREGLDPL